MSKHTFLPGAVRLLGVALLTAAALALPGTAQGQISVVVAAGSQHTADLDMAARIFSGQVTTWSDGTKIQIVDQASSASGQAFYADVLRKSASQVRKAMTALLLSGQIPKPEQVASDAEVKAAVARLSGSIGYIASSSLDDSVREIARVQ